MEYPDGMTQPGIVAYFKVRGEGDVAGDQEREETMDQQHLVPPKGTPVFRWALKPSSDNMQGAKDRPQPEDLWQVRSVWEEVGSAPVPVASLSHLPPFLTSPKVLKTIIEGKTVESMEMGTFSDKDIKKNVPHLYDSA